MNKYLIIFLVLLSTKTLSQNVEPIKIFDRGNHYEVGFYLECGYGSISTEISPNPILISNQNHFDILFSLATSSGIICSPIPPEFVDQVRHYFSLGSLSPGTYSISASYVNNDQAIPALNSPELILFDHLDFSIPHPIPLSNPLGLALLIISLLLIAINKIKFCK